MKSYLGLMEDILKNGKLREDRTGTGTIGLFGRSLRFDLSQGFPLVTTKKINFSAVVAELLWFLSGSTQVKDLQAMGCHIWDPWAREDGTLGPIYGSQWRKWKTHDGRTVDQIADVVEGIRKNPTSRRLVVSAWNVGEIPDMALPPCHALFQFYVEEGQKLSCHLYQRSCDVFIGLPFNIASYALLTHMIAKETGLVPGEFLWTGGDVHLYQNHLSAVKTQLARDTRPLPRVSLATDKTLDTYSLGDIVLEGYSPHPWIKADVSV